jgi:predicted AlkP superfamily phosphohydrolase/phosphomutase
MPKNTSGEIRRRNPIVVLGLDAFEPDLLRRWLAEGRLPFLSSQIEKGIHVPLSSWILTDVPWPSLTQGVSPATHAFYTHIQLKRGTVEIERIDAHHCRRLPFWADLRGKGFKIAVLDVPKTFPIEGVDGVQVCGWGEHYALLPRPQSLPANLIGELQAKFGSYVHPPELTPAPSRLWERKTRRHLLENLERKRRATEHLLGLDDWDVFFSVFADVHYADHQFLHHADPSHWAHDPDAPAELKEALPVIASRLDAALASVCQRLSPDTTLLLLSVHGIAANYSGNEMVPWLLERMGVMVPAPRVEATNAVGRVLGWTGKLRSLVPGGVRKFINTRLIPDAVHDRAQSSHFGASVDWPRTRAFLLPSDHFQACISFNLRGREPNGIVEPGAEADALYEMIRAHFLRLENADTGRPAVAQVLRSSDLFSGPHLSELPDIIVDWAHDQPIQRIRHPEFGTMSLPPGFEPRRSQHTARGFLIASGPGIDTRAKLAGASILDIAPTILHMLGQPVPEDMEGRILHELLSEPRASEAAADTPVLQSRVAAAAVPPQP